jgi:hypothetical protein
MLGFRKLRSFTESQHFSITAVSRSFLENSLLIDAMLCAWFLRVEV